MWEHGSKIAINFFSFRIILKAYSKLNDKDSIQRTDDYPIESEPNFLPMSCIAEFNISSSASLRQ